MSVERCLCIVMPLKVSKGIITCREMSLYSDALEGGLRYICREIFLYSDALEGK